LGQEKAMHELDEFGVVERMSGDAVLMHWRNDG
jgi:hypothetical protein